MARHSRTETSHRETPGPGGPGTARHWHGRWAGRERGIVPRCLSVALAALLTATLAGNASAAPAEPGGGIETREVSRAQFLAWVQQLLAAGRIDEAEALVNQLPDKGPLAFDKLFLQARIARLRGDLAKAENIYRSMLSANPGLYRVRLELAQTLFEEGRYDAADYHFRLVLAANIDPEVRDRIRQYLAAMRQDRWWTGHFEFAVVPDSNINTGPSVRQVTIFGLPFQLTDNTTQKSGVGIETAAEGDVRPRIADDVRLAIGGRVFARDFSGADFDDDSVTLRAGPIYAHGAGEAGLYAVGTKRWYATEPYSLTWGGRLFGDYDFSDRINGGLGLGFFETDVTGGDALDGQIYVVDGQANYTFDDRSVIYLFGSWIGENLVDPSESFNSFQVGVGYSRELPWGLLGYVAPEIRFRNNGADSPLFGVTRADTTYRIEARLIFRQQFLRELLPGLGDCAPFISAAYEVNDSNTEIYQYTRLRGAIGFTSRF